MKQKTIIFKVFYRGKVCIPVLFILFFILLFQPFVGRGLAAETSDEKEKNFRTRFRQAVIDRFPEMAMERLAAYGLRHFNPENEKSARPNDKTVILIHGLDDPGKVWMNLAPELGSHGFKVWTMTYPNDQSPLDSARLFADQMSVLRQMGTRRIVIIAHSMGGLVSREMLTRPDIGYERLVKSGDLPRVDQLIMVGTPNHGSQLARFRVLGEVREQLVHMGQGRWHWLDSIMDGAGEAKIDLLPESRFLTELNARPHPSGVKMLVIAGNIGHVEDARMKAFVNELKTLLPDGKKNLAGELQGGYENAAREIGDGWVTVDSALLPGVPHVIVSGTHLSIIRNIMADSGRIPPAIPVILDQIAEKGNSDSN